MKQRINIFTATLFVAGLSLLALNGCKEDTIINANIVPVGDTINITQVPDTITILSKTAFDDSMVTSLSISGIPLDNALGTISDPSDPYMGKVYGSFYFQIIPPKTAFNFTKAPDSAVLILPYSKFAFGDTTISGPQTFTVYEVTDSLSLDSTYYNFTYKNIDRANPLGSVQITNIADVKQTLSTDTAGKNPFLRIKLSQAFVDKIKAGATEATNFADNPKFLAWFKGLCIEPDTNNGRAVYFFRLDGSTNFTRANVLFYHTEQVNSHDTVISESFFYTSSYCAHFNRIRRNYSGSQIAAALASTAPSDNNFFIQNEPGAYADLKLPFIKNLPKQPINKAELIVTHMSIAGSNPAYFPPERLYPQGINSDGYFYTLLDRFPITSTEPLNFMDGNRRSVTIAGVTYSQYVLNIPREVQKAIVEQRDTLHLRIGGASGYPGAYRLIGAGRALDSSFRVKLNIIYSKI